MLFATPLQFTGLKYFENIFAFLFVLVLLFAVLTRFELFKEKVGFAALIALAGAVLTMLSSIAVRALTLAAPWFVVLFFFGVLVLIAYSAFGIKEETVLKVITESEYSNTFAWWVIAISLVIIVGSVSKAVSEQEGFLSLTQPGDDVAKKLASSGTEEGGFFATMFHPKILGLFLILLVAMFTIKLLAETQSR